MELIKGGGEQTPQDEHTSATDMISRQRRDDRTRVEKFARGADRICASTLGWKAAAAKKTDVADWRYMKHLWLAGRAARGGSLVTMLSNDATFTVLAVCHGDVKPEHACGKVCVR